uniref:Uncharacterized protein n=1 Tax=Clandestinovirus TaxID=2831644 RepID=A0A8F8PR24_9VIRU|nr:hypothetical protein KOM_12_401 [Clandestinovirus]
MNTDDMTIKKVTYGAIAGLSLSAILLVTKRLFKKSVQRANVFKPTFVHPNTIEQWEKVVASNKLVATFVGSPEQYETFLRDGPKSHLPLELTKSQTVWMYVKNTQVMNEDGQPLFQVPLLVIHKNNRRVNVVYL